MRLLNIKISGFRRLDGVSLNLDGRLIAVVGPNEAGKSSLLDAVTTLDVGDAIKRHDVTHGMGRADDSVVVAATYLLDAEDKAALAAIPEASDARYFFFQRRADGSSGSDVQPHPQRDLSPRREGARKLERVTALRAIREARLDDAELDELLSSAATIAASQDSSLSEEDRQALGALADRLAGDGATATTRGAAAALRELVAHESQPEPRAAARRVMLDRRPRAVQFTDADRRLRDEYDVDDFRTDPPRALANLVPRQATFALLMVSALLTISRSRGWVAACRFRQAM